MDEDAFQMADVTGDSNVVAVTSRNERHLTMKDQVENERNQSRERVAMNDPFTTLVSEFSARTAEVKNLFMSRVDGNNLRKVYRSSDANCRRTCATNLCC